MAQLIQGPSQRLIYVLNGVLKLEEPGKSIPHDLAAGSYAYFPTGYEHTLTALTAARVAVIDKPSSPSTLSTSTTPAPTPTPGSSSTASPTSPPPPSRRPRPTSPRLLPDSHIFDFAVNTMTYDPGAALSQVEIHYMEHGLLMLEGGGIYRLGDSWYPTKAGDFIWMSAYCPQWFGALGKAPAKYLIYKDFNRHPLG